MCYSSKCMGNSTSFCSNIMCYLSNYIVHLSPFSFFHGLTKGFGEITRTQQHIWEIKKKFGVFQSVPKTSVICNQIDLKLMWHNLMERRIYRRLPLPPTFENVISQREACHTVPSSTRSVPLISLFSFVFWSRWWATSFVVDLKIRDSMFLRRLVTPGDSKNALWASKINLRISCRKQNKTLKIWILWVYFVKTFQEVKSPRHMFGI